MDIYVAVPKIPNSVLGFQDRNGGTIYAKKGMKISAASLTPECLQGALKDGRLVPAEQFASAVAKAAAAEALSAYKIPRVYTGFEEDIADAQGAMRGHADVGSQPETRRDGDPTLPQWQDGDVLMPQEDRYASPHQIPSNFALDPRMLESYDTRGLNQMILARDPEHPVFNEADPNSKQQAINVLSKDWTGPQQG